MKVWKRGSTSKRWKEKLANEAYISDKMKQKKTP